jgi:hypothetical protein
MGTATWESEYLLRSLLLASAKASLTPDAVTCKGITALIAFRFRSVEIR